MKSVLVGKMIHEYKDRIFPENLEEIIGHPDYPMKSVPVEKKLIEVEIVGGVEGDCLVVNNYRIAGPKPWGGGRSVKTFRIKESDFLALDFISQALQAAKEERDVELLEKIIEMKDKQYEDRQILSVIQGELSIGSIINKHQ